MVGHNDTAAILRKHGYKEIKKIGEGSFGKAILVETSDRSKLVCKMVDVSRASQKETADAIKEGKVLASLSHPYIVRYRESFTDSGWFCILMDFCEGGDLTKSLEQAKRSRKPLTEEQILKWFVQAIMSLKYLHDRHILHRDLKPQNFFLSKEGDLMVGDFGIAKVLDCTLAVAKTQIGTPYYLSPELCQEKPYTTPSDVWAMGCILYEMCALKVPFDGSSIAKLVQNIVKGQVPTAPSSYSQNIRQLVTDMLNRDPNRRPSCDDILAKPFIQAVVDKLNAQGAAQEQAAAPVQSFKVEAKALEGPFAEKAGTYKKGDLVEYQSTAHKSWLPATITNVDLDGNIMLDLKPNTWISKEKQASVVRPRTAAPAGPTSAPHGQRSSTPGRAASPRRAIYGDSPRDAPSVAAASRRRSPSVGSMCGGRPASRDGQPAGQPAAGTPMSGRGAAGNYRNGDLCEFWSNSHSDWLPAQVIKCDAAGRIIIDLKPNTWLSREDQSNKIRPRRAAAAPGTPTSGRRPQASGSPQLPRPPLQRSPSWCSDHQPSPAGRASGYRAPSPSGRAMTPLGNRATSPSGRAMTPMGQRAASPAGRPMTPVGQRAPSPSGRASNPMLAPSPSGRNIPSPMELRMGLPAGSLQPGGSRAASPCAARAPSPSAFMPLHQRDSPGRCASPFRPPRVAASPLRAGGAAIAGRWN